ncbi:hypothetical protein [Deminuibacter soli]|uniref:Uncharacterized protein n=1 Tax=Deminuibacter soli TaxID=2291815 RepID=A0A3E1NK29_9BACT|nr:hypothetical protein [Deminuibacter soli]RFM28273.1 hypothetical protein DXN05_12230 [Deminuibacter soli]
MEPKNKHTGPLPHQHPHQTTKTEKAHEQAEKDIAQDADLSIHSPNDDLDEEELSRLGGDKNDLI